MAHLTFDELAHKYFLDGEEIPSVTQVMKASGIIDSRFYNEEGRKRGTAVHVACQYLDEGDLDWDSLDEAILAYVKAYENFKIQSEFFVNLIEHQVCHPTLNYAGTLDRTGVFKNIGGPIVELIDIKTGNIPKWGGIQLAGYALALGLEHGTVRRFGLQLKQNGQFKIQEFKDSNDYDVFLAAVKIFHKTKIIDQWRLKNG